MRALQTRSVLPLLVVASVVVLSGCTRVDDSGDAAGSPASSPTTSASSSSTPSSSPSATPSPTASTSATSTLPDLVVADTTTWLITFRGIGPLQIGGTLAALRTTMEPTYASTGEGGLCAGWQTGAEFSSIVPLASSESDPIPWTAMLAGSVPSGQGTPRTAAGIGLGSTADEVLAAYPDATEEQGTYGPNLAITDNGGMFIDFTLSEDRVVNGIVVIDNPIAPGEYCA